MVVVFGLLPVGVALAGNYRTACPAAWSRRHASAFRPARSSRPGGCAIGPCRPATDSPGTWTNITSPSATAGKACRSNVPGEKPDGTGWPLEQCAYWLDGALRLGFVLHDEAFIEEDRTGSTRSWTA